MKKMLFTALFLFSIVSLVSAYELETLSDRSARHQSEEYQAKQNAGQYQINVSRNSSIND